MSLNIHLLRTSFDQAKPIARDVAELFYQNLWADFPEVKPLFADTRMDAQKAALVQSLVTIVDNLENPDKLTRYLKAMGGRHAGYRIEERHYPMVGQTLLKTFGQLFGSAWTPELNQAWADAYGVIAGVMLEGAAEAAATQAGGKRPRLVNPSPTPGPAAAPAGVNAAPEIAITIPESLLNELRAVVRDAVRGRLQAEINRLVAEELQALLTPEGIRALMGRAA